MNSERVADVDVVVVGAGIAGLSAARELVAAGLSVLVLDKGRGLGGRMATRRLGRAVCDHGAQFFTVRGRAFGGIVAAAHDDDAVVEWCRGFSRDGSLGRNGGSGTDGHPRWHGREGMTDLPKWIAARLADEAGSRIEIRRATRVASVGVDQGRVTLGFEDGEPVTARGGILTPPPPQSLDLLAAGGLTAAAGEPVAAACETLTRVTYDPSFALMLVLDKPSRVPPPGGIQFDPDAGGPLAWIGDNQQKGISPMPALTIHADGAFSRRHFETPPDEVMAMLIDHARPWIDGDPATAVIDKSLQRWKFALPTALVAEPLIAVSHVPPLACCGDAFAGPRVEGAASSGLAAGRWLVRALCEKTASGDP